MLQFFFKFQTNENHSVAQLTKKWAMSLLSLFTTFSVTSIQS